MRLKINEFENFAKSIGYYDGYELSLSLGCGELTYDFLRQGGRVGSDIVAEIYNRFGAEVMEELIDFEDDNLESFENKYVKIGNKLY